jgi:hypothetical protein
MMLIPCTREVEGFVFIRDLPMAQWLPGRGNKKSPRYEVGEGALKIKKAAEH